MTRKDLREFITLAEVGNFTDAADQLFLSQSSLSRHIMKLESTLGVRLFTRTTKSVILNEYGQKFLPYAQRMLKVQDECIRAFSDEIHRMVGHLKIGVFMLDEPYKYTDIITKFRAKYWEYVVNLFENRTSVLKDSIMNGTCDFAVILNQPGYRLENMEYITLATDSLAAILPATHPLAAHDMLDLKLLKDETVIMQDESNFYYQLYMKAIRQFGIFPNMNICNLNSKSIIKMVEYDQGITFRPKQLALNTNNAAIAVVDTKPAININVDLIYRRDKPCTVAGNDLLKFIRDTLKHEQN